MKTIKTLIPLSLIICSFSFASLDEEAAKNMLRVGDTISFSNKIPENTRHVSMLFKKSGYDGGGFEFVADSNQHITLSNITQPTGPVQDEFFLFGLTGILTRNQNDVAILPEKGRSFYYLADLNNATVVGKYDTIIKVTFRSETPSGKQAEYFCYEKNDKSFRVKDAPADSQPFPAMKVQNIHLTAVPKNIRRKDLSAAYHPPRTIARFTRIEVHTSDGRIYYLPHGSYILCEGKSLTIN